MHDAADVQGLEPAQYFNAYAHGIYKREWTARETDCQRLTLESLHGKEERSVGLANLVDLADVWMIDSGGSASFPPEPVARERMIDGVLPDGFQRDRPSETRIYCVIDDTHPAFAEEADYTKCADLFRQRCHSGRDSTVPLCPIERERFARSAADASYRLLQVSDSSGELADRCLAG
jgi:hypothetical protein